MTQKQGEEPADVMATATMVWKEAGSSSAQKYSFSVGFHHSEVFCCSMLRPMNEVEVCLRLSGKHRKVAIQLKLLRGDKCGTKDEENHCRRNLPQWVFFSFSNQLLLLAAITHLLTPNIYYSKCQRCPSFYFPIFLGEDAVSLPSQRPLLLRCTEPNSAPSLCQCLSPILLPSFFAFFLGLLHPNLPLFLFRSWQLKSAGRAACLLQGEVFTKKKGEQRIRSRTDGGYFSYLSTCLLVVFWLTLSVWSLESSFQFLSSDVKEMAHCKAGSIIDKRLCALYIFFLNIHLFSWRVLLHMRHRKSGKFDVELKKKRF